jgi:GntR family phosphonate transport system transcriptional regulator
VTADTAAGGSLWQGIRDALASDVATGRYAPGAKLPTEAALARRFGVNRHTVRRALAALSEAGQIHVRRGAGAFVTQPRLDYAIGPRTRFSQNLSATGLTPARRILRIETVNADDNECMRLDLKKASQVHVTESISEANGTPVTYSRMAFPAERLPTLPQALAEQATITAALAAVGVADYQRLWTRLSAERPGAMIARHLRMREASPVLRSESLDVDAEGRPVCYGVSWFCSERVQLVVDRSSFP